MVRGDAGVEHQMIDGTLGYSCPRCGIDLVENPDDDVNDYELEGDQVRHTIKRCREVEANTQPKGPFNVIVNGEGVVCLDTSIAYEAVIGLAGYNPRSTPSVTYRRNDGSGGILMPGQLVTISEGTVFNIVTTGRG